MERQALKAGAFWELLPANRAARARAFASARRCAWNRPSCRGQSARASNRRKHVKEKQQEKQRPYRFSDRAAAEAGRHRHQLSPEIVTPHDPVRAEHPTPEPTSPTNSRAHHRRRPPPPPHAPRHSRVSPPPPATCSAPGSRTVAKRAHHSCAARHRASTGPEPPLLPRTHPARGGPAARPRPSSRPGCRTGRVATRYEKHSANFPGLVLFAAIRAWLA